MQINLFSITKLSLFTAIFFSNAVFAKYCNPNEDGSANCDMAIFNDTGYTEAECFIKGNLISYEPNPLTLSSQETWVSIINTFIQNVNYFDFSCKFYSNGTFKGECSVSKIRIKDTGFDLTDTAAPTCKLPDPNTTPLSMKLQQLTQTRLQANFNVGK